jgi:hypothetical protein
MFSILAFNPFGSMLGSIGSSAGGSHGGSIRGGRTLLELMLRDLIYQEGRLVKPLLEAFHLKQ